LRKVLAEIFEIQRLGALFLYLERPELGARTQGPGKYCRKVSTWILQTWNAEIPCIIELPVEFSVANVGAGAQNGYFGQRCKVFSTKECWCGLPTPIDVGGNPFVGVSKLRLTRTAVVVVEIWGEGFPLRGIWLRSQWGE
jgi:hypothetical protein